MEFNIDQQGIYVLSGWYPNGNGLEIVLAVGKDPFDSLISMIIVGIAIDIGSVLAAIAIVITVYRRRKKDEQRLKNEAEAIRGRRLS